MNTIKINEIHITKKINLGNYESIDIGFSITPNSNLHGNVSNNDIIDKALAFLNKKITEHSK